MKKITAPLNERKDMDIFNRHSQTNNRSVTDTQVSEEQSSSSYGKFLVPFIRESRAVKRVKLGDSDAPVRQSLSSISSSSSKKLLRRNESSLEVLETRLATNSRDKKSDEQANKSHFFSSEPDSVHELPHPSQLSGKRKQMPAKKHHVPESVITEHLSQLQQKQQHLLRETKCLESAVVRRNPLDLSSFDNISSNSTPSVIIKTTNQCLMRFCTSANWSSALANSPPLMSYSANVENVTSVACGGGMMFWENRHADIQRQIVQHAGGPKNIVVTASHTDRKRKVLSPTRLSHSYFQNLYKCSFGQLASFDESNSNGDGELLNFRYTSETPAGYSKKLPTKLDVGNSFSAFSSPYLANSTDFSSCNSNIFQVATPPMSSDREVPSTDNFCACSECDYDSLVPGLREPWVRKNSLAKEE